MTGLYIHVPFCVRKCRYCDFYSGSFSEEAAEKYTEAVIRNIAAYNIKADTVYFGGGTPSLLSPRQFDRILSAADISDNAEISIECNPKTADKKKLADFRSVGINRLSIGVQSFNDTELKAAGRIHSADEAADTILAAEKSGFENISADLMLGLPYQTPDSLNISLKRLAELPVRHISAYMLKVEENTPLAKDISLLENIPDDDGMADMYIQTCDFLNAHGLGRYEISNFAKDGFECRHNLIYWRCEDYLGIGPSAHSCCGGKRFAVDRNTDEFISSPRQIIHVTDDSPCGYGERIMLALRLREGINAEDYPFSAELMKNAVPLEKGGFVKINGTNISLTDSGCLVSNEIICRIVGDNI